MLTKPTLHSLDDFGLEVKSANGTLVHYLGYIETAVKCKSFPDDSITTLFLVVPTTDYHHNVPVLIGTNIIREFKEQASNIEETPEEWKTAFMSVLSASVGIVTTTQAVTLQPMETRTISGFVRKIRNVEAAVTEPVENSYQQKPLICPRVVELTNAGRTARVPVKICNMSAKVMKIPMKTEICQLNEVKVLRKADICDNSPSSEKDKTYSLINDEDNSKLDQPTVLQQDNLLSHEHPNLSAQYLPTLSSHVSSSASHLHSQPEIENKQATSKLGSEENPYLPELHVHQQHCVPEKEKETHNNEYNIKEDFGVDIEESKLTFEQKQKVYTLFKKWESVFPKNAHDLGQTSAVKHKIELTDNTPFKESYRRVPPAIYNEVREHLQEMLNIGAIQESKSPWSSNVVIVRKKDGTIRFCIDYRKLNNRTKKDAYAIPRVDDTLHLLAGSQYFSKLDLKSGYWQVEMEEADKEKTAFQVWGIGFFECNRMPFGLCNAPATFQRLMERCMGDLNLKDCLIYLDDIIIFSKDIDSHIERLDAVFQRLSDNNLKIKPSKCQFFKDQITYLGHVVSKDGIQTDPEKTNVVKDWPTPKSVKEVRKFLGFVGYFRRFVKGFATIARPLNNLLIGHPLKADKQAKRKAKRQPFIWGNEQEESFQQLKQKLINPPILAYADYSQPFKLHTDASKIGLGAVLYQKQDGKDRVIAYASRSLKPAEKNYPAHKLEYLALKWSVTEKFHDYLYGTSFEVITDNNPLVYVSTSAKLDATGQRWMAALSNYNFKITYRSGKHNADADGLSRINIRDTSKQNSVDQDIIKAMALSTLVDTTQTPIATSVLDPDSLDKLDPIPADEIPTDIILSHSLSSKNWRQAQLQDPVLSTVIDHMEKGTRPSAKRVSGNVSPVVKYLRDWDILELKDGVLYRSSQFKGQSYKQLLLPEVVREEVFQALHDDLGHQGRDRTTSLFKQRFFWPGMDSYIEEKVQQCPRCIKRKALPAKASLVSISSTAPMEIVCIDFLSLERSKGGFEHILVVTDHFTRYAQAFPTRNQTAATTAKVLFEQFFVHYGFPNRIHSDQGANFESNLIKELFTLAGISKSHTTPYHAMGNGQCERFNQTLLKMLGTLPETKKSDWKSYVAPMVHAYNVTIHSSTGFSPYFIMFGRHPKLAIDALLGINFDGTSAKSRNEYVRKLRDRLSLAYNKAKQTADETAEVYKQQYDQKAKAAMIRPGDIVLFRNVTLRGKTKIADKWESDPYVVLSQPDKNIPVYQIRKQRARSRKVRTVHRNHLLPLKSSSQEDNEGVNQKQTPTYVIPQRRCQDVLDADSSTSVRPIRNRRQPHWQRTGQWDMS